METNKAKLPKKPVTVPLGAAVMTCAEVGEILGIHRNSVWKAEQSALKKMRRILAQRLGSEFFEEVA